MVSSMARDNDSADVTGADAAQGAPALAPAPACDVMSADSEARCLTRFLKRSALAAGILIAALVAAAIVISAVG